MNSKKIKIVITDSGLGGISVLAEIEKILQEKTIAENVDLIYANAYAGEGFGYNQMKSVDQKVEVFNSFLNSINQHFYPDLIIIACNTLSVIYDLTEFAKKSDCKVLGIVEAGTSQILSSVNENEELILLMGTETTIHSEVHKNLLIKNGINKENIITKPCPNLESEIQKDNNGVKTEKLISTYIKEALFNKSLNNKKIICGLFCTHYGYSFNLFTKVLGEFSDNFHIINPNNKLAEQIFTVADLVNLSHQQVDVSVYSKNKLDQNDILIIGKLTKLKSQKTFLALKNYIYKKDLFTFE